MKENYEIQKKFIYVFLNTIIIITLFLSMLKLINSSILNSNSDYIYSLGQNWKAGPVMDIKIINKIKDPNSECSDYNMESLLNDYWSGTVKGCEIDNIIVRFQCHLIGSLSKPIDKVKYKYWDGAELCAKRINSTYFDLVKEKINCPIHYKSCGIIDNLGNQLCVKNEEKCPLNYIKLEDKSKTELPPLSNIPDSIIILETQNKYLYYSNEMTNAKIVNEVIISDLTPCTNPKFKNNYPNSTYDLDLFYKHSHCGNFSDNSPITETKYSLLNSNYEQIDELFYLLLLKDNNIIQNFNNLPNGKNFTEISAVHPTNLYFQNYVSINSFCIDNLEKIGVKKDDLLNSFLSIKIYLSQIDEIFFVIFVCFFTLFFFDFLLLIRHYVYYWFPVFSYISSWKIKIIYSSSFLILLITHMVCFYYMLMLDSILDYIREIRFLLPSYNSSNIKCLDDLSNEILNNFYNSLVDIKVIWVFINICIWINIVCFSVELILMLEIFVYSAQNSQETRTSDEDIVIHNNIEMKPFKVESDNSFQLNFKTCEKIKSEENERRRIENEKIDEILERQGITKTSPSMKIIKYRTQQHISNNAAMEDFSENKPLETYNSPTKKIKPFKQYSQHIAVEHSLNNNKSSGGLFANKLDLDSPHLKPVIKRNSQGS